MGISAISQRLLRIPTLTGTPSQEVGDRARRRRVPPRLRLLLKLGIGALIVVLLLMMVWVEPVVSRQHPLEDHSDGTATWSPDRDEDGPFAQVRICLLTDVLRTQGWYDEIAQLRTGQICGGIKKPHAGG